MVRIKVRLQNYLVSWARKQAVRYRMPVGRFVEVLVEEHMAFAQGKRRRSSMWPRWPRPQRRR